MRLFLVRHGESIHTQERRIAGPSGCRGLTPRGFTQAEALGQRLQRSGEAGSSPVLLCSNVLRARQTAETVAQVFPGVRVETFPGLCELLPGAADGLTGEEYRTRFGSFDLMAEPDRPYAPGGESWNQFTTRALAVMDELASRYAGQTVLAATHAGFIVVTILLLFAVPRPGARGWIDPHHTGITEWHPAGDRWTLVRYNDTAHLH